MLRPHLLLMLIPLLLSNIATAAPPNLVVILADDLGYECLSANGSDSYKTPRLDALAAGGMRFDRAYSQPLCTPTRVQLMTGRYNVWNYTSFGELSRKETTFAQLLKPAGYATGIFGKWQLGQEVDSPQHFGFDTSCLWQQTRRPSRYPNPGLEFNGDERDFTSGEFGPDVVNEEVLKFIDKHHGGPFLVYYPMILVHNPFIPVPGDPAYDPAATNENAGQNKRFFAGMITRMDQLVGNVIDRLEKYGLRDNTLILFIGDNGTNRGITSQFQGRSYEGGKGQSKTPGMHVPFIANWPAVIPAGKVSTALVDTTDVLPTLLDAAGVKLPASTPTDGTSLLPVLKNESAPHRNWMYSWHPTAAREFAADHNYKLYADGTFVEYASDSHQERPQTANTADLEAARASLQKVLDRYSKARPTELKARDGNGYQSGRNPAPVQRKARKKAA